MMTRGDLPLMQECERGRLYRLDCRNLALGVWNGTDGFIGIRTKFGTRFLATEFHWDLGAPYGTVREAIPLDARVPEAIALREYPNNPELFQWLLAQEEEKP